MLKTVEQPETAAQLEPLVGPLPPIALTPKESDLWSWAWDGLNAVLDDSVFLRDNPGFELCDTAQRQDMLYRLDEQLADVIASPSDAESMRTRSADERARRSLVVKLKQAWGE
jgi:hypothetical protein